MRWLAHGGRNGNVSICSMVGGVLSRGSEHKKQQRAAEVAPEQDFSEERSGIDPLLQRFCS